MSIVKHYYVTLLYFHIIGTVTVADNKWKIPDLPDDGEILGYGGFINTLGSGAGTSTDIQIRNEETSRDYFDTKPTFEVDSATKKLEGGDLIDSPTFKAGQTLVLDVDAVSTNPADVDVWLLVGMHHEVS